ncbi:type VI secretion system ImpA family N-terminal domain-containing protein [Variovorax sp. J22R133]|uniref:type VI secretion system protein TssA n=1 Tax=Variovorax brevis TaxID=3053503 RepID=UPI0025757314|nr:type VI secretion system ImpA family N-terminal domain-containing protein [Variovorax sp. J22R133]MDM0112106.1 type VI secretion system ImpA family N-terminal domain-containing protein [Variovorax sp. J22R133]
MTQLTHAPIAASAGVPECPTPDWLMPINAQAPCGISLEYDAEFAVLLSRMTPRGEAQYGGFVDAPEGPNWAEIERDCRRLMLRTKDINLLVWLCRARTRLAHAAGLAQVLQMIATTLHTWPEAVHPQLMVDGELDPAVRANALAALVDPDGLLADVREIVIATHTGVRLSVRDVERAFAIPRSADALGADAVTQQLQALREAAAGDAKATINLLALSARKAHDIAAWCKRYLADDAPSLQALLRILDHFAEPAPEPDLLQERAEGLAGQGAHAEEPWHGATPRAGSKPATRAQVLVSIRQAREWFEAHEPSSPVAVLLLQAERMVGKRFSQIADSIPLDLLRKWDSEESDGASGEPS